MNLFRVRGIQLAVHVSFFLLLAVQAFAGWSDSGVSGLFWHSFALIAFFGCVVLHELGHSLTAMRYGIGVRRILLLPIGGMAEFESIPREPRREIAITLAGPAVNFVLAGLFWLILLLTGPHAETDEMTWATFALLLLQGNLLMGVFNLLPAFPMDGGRILRAVLAGKLGYLRATFWAAMVGKVLCALGTVVAFLRAEPLLLLLFAFILFVGELEYRAVERRERQDAELRAVINQLYDFPPPLKEPPLLEPVRTRSGT